MKSRYLIAACTVLLAAVGITIAQPEIRPRPVAPPEPAQGSADRPGPRTDSDAPPSVRGGTAPAFPNAPVATAPAAHATSTAKEVKPEDLTIDQLLDAVEKFESQKAELEKKQRTFIKVLRLKASLQKQRIDSLPGSPQVALPYAVSEPSPPANFPAANIPDLDLSPLPAKPQR